MENKKSRKRKPLVRPREGRKLGGVCLGVAEWLEVDVSIIRVLFLLALLLAFGSGALVYLLMWLVVPNEY